MVKRIFKFLFWWLFINWIPYNISEAIVEKSREKAGKHGDPKFKGYETKIRWVWLCTIDNIKEAWNNCTYGLR